MALVAEYANYAAQITKRIKNPFANAQMKDLIDRPCVAIITDGATIRTDILNDKQRALQTMDRDEAYALGRSLAEKGMRVILPGYLGLCQSVIEGVRAGGGHYIVATTKQSVQFDAEGNSLLPQSDNHGLHIITNTLAESKSILFALAQNFIYHKGGLGALDIFTDYFVLEQTDMLKGYRLSDGHRHKLIMLNDDGFWQPVINMTEHFIQEGFADRKPEKDDSKIIIQAASLQHAIDMAVQDVYPPDDFTHDLFAGAPHIFIPSKAITLAGSLSKQSVMSRIKAADGSLLLPMLKAAKRKLVGGDPIDPTLEQFATGKNVAVYCGARIGHNSAHKEAAQEVGELIHELGLNLIYGGSRYGIMGTVADAFISAASLVHKGILAVTPFSFLTGGNKAANEGFHQGITATIGVPGMQERKMLMTSLTDVTIMLTGAWGSLDETLEELRVNLLSGTNKKIIVYNVNGYWDALPSLFEKAIERGYMKAEDLKKIEIVDNIPALRASLQASLRSPSLSPAPWPQ